MSQTEMIATKKTMQHLLWTGSIFYQVFIMFHAGSKCDCDEYSDICVLTSCVLFVTSVYRLLSEEMSQTIRKFPLLSFPNMNSRWQKYSTHKFLFRNKSRLFDEQ